MSIQNNMQVTHAVTVTYAVADLLMVSESHFYTKNEYQPKRSLALNLPHIYIPVPDLACLSLYQDLLQGVVRPIRNHLQAVFWSWLTFLAVAPL